MSRIRGFMKLYEDAVLPTRETEKAAGYDIHAYIPQSIEIKPGEHAIIKTGITAYMLDDEHLDIRPRSGLALKQGITVLNSPGLVDADYEGHEIGVILYNTTKLVKTIFPRDRIAQCVFEKYLLADGDEREGKQTRTGGFGSTGK